MRQETGSNITSHYEKISVRLPANGDFFVIDEFLDNLAPYCNSVERDKGRVRVELLTKRMMLIPTERLSQDGGHSIAQRELSSIGVTYYAEEQVVSLSSGGVTALVVVPKILIETLEERCGLDSVSFEVPLLRSAVVAERHMIVDTYRGVTTIKLFAAQGEGGERGEGGEGGECDSLLFADVYETPTDASAIYWVQRVSQAMSLSAKTPLYIYRCSGTMRRLLQRDFNKILVCE